MLENKKISPKDLLEADKPVRTGKMLFQKLPNVIKDILMQQILSNHYLYNIMLTL
jgi:hypothetical protein